MDIKNKTSLGNIKVFAENFQYYLARSDYNKKDIAQKIGVSQSTITDWCKHRTYPRMDRIQKIAQVFGVEMYDLVEKHSLDLNYTNTKEAEKIARELVKDSEEFDFYKNVKKLSPENREMVFKLVKNLNKGDD